MIKGEILGNIFFIDVKDRGILEDVLDKYYNPTYVQDKYCKMDIVESIIFGQFGYPIFEVAQMGTHVIWLEILF
jgi:hypothetical protein